MRATAAERAESRWYRMFDNPNPLVKQAPTLTATVIAARSITSVPFGTMSVVPSIVSRTVSVVVLGMGPFIYLSI